MASETGVLDIPAENVLRKGRLQPGKIFLVDLARNRIVEDDEIKREIATRKPYGEWFEQRRRCTCTTCPTRPPRVPRIEPLRSRQLAFGYTQEDMRVILAPLARNAEEPIGSMGNDLALAVLSDQRPLLYGYFKQLFAQVTNPPIDSTREYVVMSVGTSVGSEHNLLDETPEHAYQLVIDQPILRNARAREPAPGRVRPLQGAHARHDLARRRGPGRARARRSSASAARPTRRSTSGVNILILSDRNLGADRVAIPALLAVSTVHHHLVRQGTRLAGRARGRVGRAARGAPLRDADRLRRRRRQPVRDARDARTSSPTRAGCPTA